MLGAFEPKDSDGAIGWDCCGKPLPPPDSGAAPKPDEVAPKLNPPDVAAVVAAGDGWEGAPNWNGLLVVVVVDGAPNVNGDDADATPGVPTGVVDPPPPPPPLPKTNGALLPPGVGGPDEGG